MSQRHVPLVFFTSVSVPLHMLSGSDRTSDANDHLGIIYNNFYVLVCPQCLSLLHFQPLVPFLYDKRWPSFPQFIKEPQQIEFPVVSFGKNKQQHIYCLSQCDWDLLYGFNAYVCSSLL